MEDVGLSYWDLIVGKGLLGCVDGVCGRCEMYGGLLDDVIYMIYYMTVCRWDGELGMKN